MSEDRHDAPGYLSEAYAASLGFAGKALRLERSGAHLIEREIPGTSARDAMAPYPILCCRDWTRLGEDLDALEGQLVSVTAVTDPFAKVDPRELADAFGALCRPFKQHAVIDLERDPETSVSSHHRRNVRKALRSLEVEVCEKPLDRLDEWCALYDGLIERHEIRGIAAFSRESFRDQLAVPGLQLLRACSGDETVGMILWYLHDDVGYYHLAAYSEEGYRSRASFALFWRSIELFRGRVRWLGLGAQAGTGGDAGDGLSRFKAGWGSEARDAYLCGRILDAERYAELAGDRDAEAYFPAYRAGEFGGGEERG